MSFVHLRNYSEYDFATGVMPMDVMVDRAKKLGMSALALTDENGLYGAFDFYRHCKTAGIKPILGLTIMVQGIAGLSKADGELVVLAENQIGWKNLMRISSAACCASPMRFDEIRPIMEGLICLTGGADAAIPKLLIQGQTSKARKVVTALQQACGASNVYLELQNHGVVGQMELLPELIKFGESLNIPLVATNASLFPKEDEMELYRVVAGAGERRELSAQSNQAYMKSTREMHALFSGVPSALENTLSIAERCTVELEGSKQFIPAKQVVAGDSAMETLETLCRDGLQVRCTPVTPRHEEQLKAELKVVNEKGFVDYFLFVKNYVDRAHDFGYMTWDRGSACGCMINFALGITVTDPFDYNLSFERFLNPQRTWICPDIDLDISRDGRIRMMQDMADRHGSSRVARVGCFYRHSREESARRVAEHLQLRSAEADRLTYCYLADDAFEGDTDSERLFVGAAKIVADMPSYPGVHPCGVAVGASDIMDFVPTRGVGEDGLTIAQSDIAWTESTELVKYDLIASKTLTVFQDVCDFVKQKTDKTLDLKTIPRDDEAVFQLFSDGRTQGIFQFNSRKMRENLCAVQPNNIEQLAALLALCRPGAVFQFDDYVKYRQNRRDVPKLHPLFDDIVHETFGLVVFQEQIQEVARKVGGFSLGDADILRRALGKGRRVDHYKETFLAGAESKGVENEIADQIFSRLSAVCRYMFNKAHAVSYAVFSYTAAYLKVHHTAEFAAALLNVHGNEAFLSKSLIDELALDGKRILPPAINTAESITVPENGMIRLGLSTIERCDPNVLKHVLDDRKQNGSFGDVANLCQRLGDVMNHQSLNALIASGALSELPGSPAQQFAVSNAAMAGERVLDMPSEVGTFDLVREIASLHRWILKDLSFDVYCPRTYSHHLRLTFWLSPDSVIHDLDERDLVDHSRSLLAGLNSEKAGDYVIGLNSKIDQYSDRHLLMLDLDSLNDDALAQLQEIGGYLLKSGVGYHFIGHDLLMDRETWRERLRTLQETPAFKGCIDDDHVELSLRRGYSTLRLVESSVKPIRPMMIRVL